MRPPAVRRRRLAPQSATGKKEKISLYPSSVCTARPTRELQDEVDCGRVFRLWPQNRNPPISGSGEGNRVCVEERDNPRMDPPAKLSHKMEKATSQHRSAHTAPPIAAKSGCLAAWVADKFIDGMFFFSGFLIYSIVAVLLWLCTLQLSFALSFSQGIVHVRGRFSTASSLHSPVPDSPLSPSI